MALGSRTRRVYFVAVRSRGVASRDWPIATSGRIIRWVTDGTFKYNSSIQSIIRSGGAKQFPACLANRRAAQASLPALPRDASRAPRAVGARFGVIQLLFELAGESMKGAPVQ